MDGTHEGRAFRILVDIDDFTRERLTLEISRQLRSDDVLHCLARLFVEKGTPDFIRQIMAPSSLPTPGGTGSARSE